MAAKIRFGPAAGRNSPTMATAGLKAVDPDIGNGGKADAEDVAQHAPRSPLRQHRCSCRKTKRTISTSTKPIRARGRQTGVIGCIAEDVVIHIEEHHVGQCPVQEVDHRGQQRPAHRRDDQDGIQALLLVLEQQASPAIRPTRPLPMLHCGRGRSRSGHRRTCCRPRR